MIAIHFHLFLLRFSLNRKKFVQVFNTSRKMKNITKSKQPFLKID